MGDEDHRIPLLVELLEEAQHLPSRAGVQGASGLVGQDDGGVPRQGPGDGHPLLLAAGELAGQVLPLLGKAHPPQGADRPLPALLGGDTGVQQGQLHVLLHGQLWDQVVLLEDKTQHFVPDFRLLVVIHSRDVGAAQVVGAGGWHVQTADDVHGRGLAGSGLAHDGHELSWVDGDIHPVQGMDLLGAHLVDLIDIFQLDEMLHLTLSLP